MHDSINTWNERLLWAYYTFKYGLRVWDFDILFEKNYFLYFCKTIHFQHQQGWGSQKYFWCLDLFTCKFIQKDFFNSSPKLFSLNFECYFSLSIKKCLLLQTMSFLFNHLYQGNRRHSWSWVWVLNLGNGKYKHV